MDRIRWGVLSTAKIAREKVIPALQRSSLGHVVAIASRRQDAARRAASTLDIPRAHGTYDALLLDPEVDAVYIPLPNHLHVPWSIKAIEAGKHVLCEKPIGLDAGDAQRLADAARAHPEVKVMEAFMYRFHPQWQRTLELVRSGSIGELRTIHTTFSYHNVAPENIRNSSESGGGALMDIGCYAVSVARFLFGSEPTSVMGAMDLDPVFGTDRLTSGVLTFSSGTSTFSCATQMVPFQRVEVFGTTGRIQIEIPFNAPPDRPCRIILQQGRQEEEFLTEAVDQYTLQADAFAHAVLHDSPVPTPLDDAVANMRAIDELRRSAR